MAAIDSGVTGGGDNPSPHCVALHCTALHYIHAPFFLLQLPCMQGGVLSAVLQKGMGVLFLSSGCLEQKYTLHSPGLYIPVFL